MHKLFFLAALVASSAAHADWTVRTASTKHTATINYGGGALSYTESATGGPLREVASEIRSLHHNLKTNLNNVVAQQIAENGARFSSGALTGNAVFTIRPQADAGVSLSLNGLDYKVVSVYSGKKWGVISFSCLNTLRLNNLAITAQYGRAGDTTPSKVGMAAEVTSSTDCDSNLSWILPVIGNLLINKAEGKIDAKLEGAIQSTLAVSESILVFKPDAQWSSVLNRLIPADKKVSLPGGGEFRLGEYIQNNIQYLVNNGEIKIALGPNNPLKGWYDWDGEPPLTNKEDMVTISLTSPAIAFSVNLSAVTSYKWAWKCSLDKPELNCVPM